MIKRLEEAYIPQVVKIHRGELHGFLPEMGEKTLKKFYEVSLTIPEIFTLVEKENEQILGFATAATSTKGLYKKIISADILSFIYLILNNFVTHPGNIVKAVKTLTYPGFADDIPELLTIAVNKRYQGRGIGTKLFKEIAREFKRPGLKKFRTSVYDKLAANNFYKKMGCQFEKSFTFLGEKMNYYSYVIRGNREI